MLQSAHPMMGGPQRVFCEETFFERTEACSIACSNCFGGMTNQNEVDSHCKTAHGGFIHGHLLKDGAHLKIIGD